MDEQDGSFSSGRKPRSRFVLERDTVSKHVRNVGGDKSD